MGDLQSLGFDLFEAEQYQEAGEIWYKATQCISNFPASERALSIRAIRATFYMMGRLAEENLYLPPGKDAVDFAGRMFAISAEAGDKDAESRSRGYHQQNGIYRKKWFSWLYI